MGRFVWIGGKSMRKAILSLNILLYVVLGGYMALKPSEAVATSLTPLLTALSPTYPLTRCSYGGREYYYDRGSLIVSGKDTVRLSPPPPPGKYNFLVGCNDGFFVVEWYRRRVRYYSPDGAMKVKFLIRSDHTQPLQIFRYGDRILMNASTPRLKRRARTLNSGYYVQIYTLDGIYERSAFPMPEEVDRLGYNDTYTLMYLKGDTLYYAFHFYPCVFKLKVPEVKPVGKSCGLFPMPKAGKITWVKRGRDSIPRWPEYPDSLPAIVDLYEKAGKIYVKVSDGREVKEVPVR